MNKTIFYIFTIKKSSIPFAFLQMAIGRRTARRIPGVTFAKLMGTGTGKTFTPSDADLAQWAILFVGSNIDAIENSLLITDINFFDSSLKISSKALILFFKSSNSLFKSVISVFVNL